MVKVKLPKTEISEIFWVGDLIVGVCVRWRGCMYASALVLSVCKGKRERKKISLRKSNPSKFQKKIEADSKNFQK